MKNSPEAIFWYLIVPTWATWLTYMGATKLREMRNNRKAKN